MHSARVHKQTSMFDMKRGSLWTFYVYLSLLLRVFEPFTWLAYCLTPFVALWLALLVVASSFLVSLFCLIFIDVIAFYWGMPNSCFTHFVSFGGVSAAFSRCCWNLARVSWLNAGYHHSCIWIFCCWSCSRIYSLFDFLFFYSLRVAVDLFNLHLVYGSSKGAELLSGPRGSLLAKLVWNPPNLNHVQYFQINYLNIRMSSWFFFFFCDGEIRNSCWVNVALAFIWEMHYHFRLRFD